MTDREQRAAAKAFAEFWKGKGYEKGESQLFWTSLLRDVFGVEKPETVIVFEEQVRLDHTSFIDAAIPSTKVLIEQKSLGKDLNTPVKQSDGTYLNPFQQAKRYITELPLSRHPRWVVTCNFAEFYVYDMENPKGEPEIIRLADLEKEFYRLRFLIDTGNEHLKRELELSVAAGEIVGLIYDALAPQYAEPGSARALKSLNVLCVRLVFCLYAEDAGVFGRRGMFHDYLQEFDAQKTRRAVIDLFKILDTPPDKRDPYLKDDNPALAAFPYVNGGLFADEEIEIPPFTDAIRELLLVKASENFDWSEISPTIFGAVFESTLNPETRRSGGMHYTSIENIHKVIDPLFLDDLKAQLREIKATAVERIKKKKRRLEEFQRKLAGLVFLDPAAGSGNFLTETYLSLRRLENEALAVLQQGQIVWADENTAPIAVSIAQFYGIEINDFAVTVAKTALWIAESQMLKETENIVQMHLDFLPLKTAANIVEGNALRMDWESVVPKTKLSYIMGNPPFVGARLMSPEQKKDLLSVFGEKWKNAGNLDYVCCWYKKAAELMAGTRIRAALVSTNSVTQGETVANLWKPLFASGVHFDFAHRTFRWDSEANQKAHVHCVIVGFSAADNPAPKRIFDNGTEKTVKNINGYLIDAPNVFVESRKKSLDDIPEMIFGSMPNDGGFLSNYSEEKKSEIIKKYHSTEKMFRQLVGAQEFINRKLRWCLWLKNISPSEIKRIPPIMAAIENVKRLREESNRESTRKLADTPMLFGEIRQPGTGNYMLVPRVSSENRKYVPMGFFSAEIIAADSVLIIPDATLYHFGILTSNVHMAWMRAVCGRLKSDYRYSIDIVYNNFPWPSPSDEQRTKIEQTAQGILDARALYPDSSLADLYDELTMPPELRRAHQANDRAVMAAYGFSLKMEESECTAALMNLYQKLTAR